MKQTNYKLHKILISGLLIIIVQLLLIAPTGILDSGVQLIHRASYKILPDMLTKLMQQLNFILGIHIKQKCISHYKPLINVDKILLINTLSDVTDRDEKIKSFN